MDFGIWRELDFLVSVISWVKKSKTKYILIISGGGCNGELPTHLIKEIERVSGKKCCDIFSMISGTSIGAIVGGLLSIGIPSQDCLQFFSDNAPVIFHREWYDFGLFSPKYKAGIIEGILKGKFGNKTLKDCKTKLLIPTFDLVSEDPFFFKSFDGKDYPLWVATRASSSAPLYFPAFKHDGHVFFDGGLFANNPEVCALAEAVKLGWDLKDIKILSLGCGDVPAKDNPEQYINCGALKNLIKVFSILFTGGTEDSDYQCKQILGDNYLSINPKVKNPLGLDDTSPKALQQRDELGREWVKNHFWQIEEFLNLK